MTETNYENGIKILKIPKELHTRLKTKAAEKEITLYDCTIEVLEKGLDGEKT